METIKSQVQPGLAEGKGIAMAEGQNAIVSRRSRLFGEEEDIRITGLDTMMGIEMRQTSSQDIDKKKVLQDDEKRASSVPVNDLMGTTLRSTMPPSKDEAEFQVKSGTKTTQMVMKRIDGAPLNFGVVCPGAIYRSSFPQPEDFAYLRGLGLKTVLTLVDKASPDGFATFMVENGIQHRIMIVEATKKANITDSSLNSMMELIMNPANHPILIHCNQGKHRTGCVVAAIRHCYGWDVQKIVEEYSVFAVPKIRECDVKYITRFQVSTLANLPHFQKRRRTAEPLSTKDPRLTRVMFTTALVLSLSWWTFLVFWNET